MYELLGVDSFQSTSLCLKVFKFVSNLSRTAATVGLIGIASRVGGRRRATLLRDRYAETRAGAATASPFYPLQQSRLFEAHTPSLG